MQDKLGKKEEASQSVKTFHKLYEKKFLSSKSLVTQERNHVISQSVKRSLSGNVLSENPESSQCLLPKLFQLQKLTKDSQKKGLRGNLLTNMDLYLAQKNIQKQQNHSALFMTETTGPIVPDNETKSKFANLISKQHAQQNKAIRGILSLVAQKQMPKEQRKQIINKQKQQLGEIVRKMIDSNRDIAIETPLLSENQLANSVVSIVDGQTKSKVFAKVKGECEKVEKNFIIRKNKSMGKLQKTH